MGQDVSNITAGGLAFTICLGVLLLVLPRRYALVPLMIGGCYMTLGQVLMIGPLHFTIFRILIFFGWVRISLRNEIAGIKFNTIDKILIAWVITSSALYIILRGGASEALIYRLGTSYNTIGIYFLIRALVWDFDDIVISVKMLGLIILPLAVLFIVEWTTGKNLFSVFGGVPEFSGIREGRLRCQGPFRNSILAGTFGATALPLFVGLWTHSSRDRLLAGGAILAATIIVITSTSSGPLLAYLTSLVGLMLWAFRTRMRIIRWGMVLSLLTLHIVMTAPVWFLIARIGDLIGGTGWHRSALIDAAIQHFDEWWLLGTTYTAHWMPTGIAIDPNNTDVTNQFISEGINGGLLSMSLFICLIVLCFKTTGNAVGSVSQFSHSERFMIWSVGAALVGHVASFFSVSYFDQIIIFWYLIIAMIASILELSPSVWTIFVDDQEETIPGADLKNI